MSDTNNTNAALKQKVKKYAVFAFAGILCVASVIFIFRPSEADIEKEKQGLGFNADIPDPKEQGIIGDKKDAYEQEQMKQKQNDRMQSLQDYAFMLGDAKVNNDELNLLEDAKPTQREVVKKQTPITNSVSAYQDINKTLGNFYEQPKVDPEKEELKQKLEELEAKMNDKDSKQSAMDEQLALMEKSYQMAAKYMPQGQNQGDPSQSQSSNESLSKRIAKGSVGSSNNGKTKITPIKQVREQTVSTLAQNISNEELYQQYDQVRNFGFNTVGSKVLTNDKNTIGAVVHDDQTLIDGQTVRLRLTEPLVAGTSVIAENSIITGVAKIQGERLEILITSLEYQAEIIPVEMTVYDTDGQRGIYIPGSMEMNAVKEIAANMGNSVGTSFTMNQSTGQQITSDLTKGLMQGASQYMTKKIRQVKVNLKSGYRLYLLPKENN